MRQLKKSQHVYLGEKEGERISEKLNAVTHDVENLGPEPINEAKSVKESTMDQLLDISNRVYKTAKYDMKIVCVTIKKYSVNKPPFIQFRLFTAKENEALKQVD